MKQGQGESTWRKEEAFGDAFRVSLRISKSPRVAHFPYHHADLNAGCGWNEKADCAGSPLVFLDLAAACGRPGPIHAYFCDHDEEAIQKLRANVFGCVTGLPEGSTVTPRAMDNGAFLCEWAADIRALTPRGAFPVGTLLCDPNGFKDMPLDALALFAAEFRCIDVVLNVNCNVFRAVEGCKKPSADLPAKTREAFSAWPTLPEIVARLCRRHWLIRNPSRACGHAFTQLIGRNTAAGHSRFKSFFPLESREGQDILSRLRTIEVGQRLLFEDMR
jgi:hypothetical protein